MTSVLGLRGQQWKQGQISVFQFPSTSRAAQRRLSNRKLVVVRAASRKKAKSIEEELQQSIVEEKAQRIARAKEIARGINDKFGEGTAPEYSQAAQPLPRLSSGDPYLDYALGGGYPKGRLIEIYGQSSSGKSTLCLQAIAAAQKNCQIAAYVDVENSFDAIYAKRIGIEEESLIYVNDPPNGEAALQIVDELAREGVDLIVVDSVSALVPKQELEGNIGDPTIGLLARLMSSSMKYITPNVHKAGTVVIFVNQLRNNINGYGSPEVTSGGKALDYHASIRLYLKANKADMIKDGDHIIGQGIQVKVDKNKTCVAGRTAKLYLYRSSGFATIESLVDGCEATKIIERRGQNYFYNNQKLALGKQRTVQYLQKKPELVTELKELLMQKSLDPLAEYVPSESPEDDLPVIEENVQEELTAAQIQQEAAAAAATMEQVEV